MSGVLVGKFQANFKNRIPWNNSWIHGDFCCKNMVLTYIPSELYYMRKWNPNSAMKLGLFVSKTIFWTWIAFGRDNVI